MATNSPTDVTADFAMDIGRTAALIAQLLKRTPGGKLTQDDIGQAIASVNDLYIAAATLELWKIGQIEFGWDREESELVLCSVEFDTQNAGQSCRPIFEGKS